MFFHAALLRSTPTADSKLSKAPKDIRLVFSEEVVASLSQITLVGPAGDSTKLKVTNDPHDVHTLVGAIAAGRSGGRYSVFWRVVSADGHLVDGTLSFSVAGPVPASTTPVVAPPPVTSQKQQPVTAAALTNAEVPVFAALLRGLGLGALMAAVGILFFGATSQRENIRSPRALILSLTLAGAVLLSAHLIAWLIHLGSTSQDETAFVTSVLRTKLGRIELLRTGLAIFALIAVAVRSYRASLVLGLACLVVSGAIGHSAAIDPAWAIPGKSIHLIAGGLWLGGLLWLLATGSADGETRRRESLRVSSYALAAVIAILLSGLLQTVLFLNTPADLLSSTYGKLVIAKIVGLLILIGYGAYNRYAVLPQYSTGGAAKLRRSMRQEIIIMSILVLIGGFLAYIAPPPSPSSSASVTGGAD